MKTKKPVPEKKENLLKKIKVRLDYKTIVVINKLSSINVWKRQYPDAQIIE
jgi:hypothetical protein